MESQTLFVHLDESVVLHDNFVDVCHVIESLESRVFLRGYHFDLIRSGTELMRNPKLAYLCSDVPKVIVRHSDLSDRGRQEARYGRCVDFIVMNPYLKFEN